MGFFNDIKNDNSIQGEVDRLAGSFSVLESGAYLMKIEQAYGITSNSGAKGLVLSLKTDKGESLKQTLWLTSGTAKGGKNTYTDKEGKQHYLPGYLQAQSLSLLAAGVEVNALNSDKGMALTWNSSLGKEIATEVPVLTDLIGKDIIVGVLKQIKNKMVRTDDGKYVPTDETKEENEIDKFFRASDFKTVAEITAQVDTASFYERWVAKNEGVTKNKYKEVSTKASANVMASSGMKKPTTSLFAQ